MDLGMIGLGKMGGYMAERLVRGGHHVIGYDRDPAVTARLKEKGVAGAKDLAGLAGQLKAPRAVWMMVPAGDPVDQTLDGLLPHLDAGDAVIDGGNSYYRDDLRRAKRLAEKQIAYVDVGTSGGVWGLTEGYCMMVGGEKAVVDRLRPIFDTLAPSADKGWGHVGPVASGHFVKMVHNGIEYGMMQAYVEGFDLMGKKSEFEIDLHQVAEIWRYGSVIRSWLLDLAADALQKNPNLEGVAPFVADSGEGRWTVIEGTELKVPLPVITAALFNRYRSQEAEPFADKLLAVLRHEFGGHAVKSEAKAPASPKKG
jgi:6-phosphogluconate dehydrogenase